MRNSGGLDSGVFFSGAVLITANNGEVTHWSPKAKAQLGWTARDVVGRDLRRFLAHADEQPAAAKPGRELVFDTKPRKVKAKHKGGAESFLELESLPLTDASGARYGHVHVLRPVRNDETETAAPASPPSPAAPAGRDALRQLNDHFASIHSSLELALANEVGPAAESLLVQAQASARRGAQVVHDLRGHEREPAERARRSGTPESEPAVARDKSGGSRRASPGKSRRILVAEDDDSIRMLIQTVLDCQGYQVIEASNGEEAVNQCRAAGPFDLVVLDLRMPRLDGRKALERIRALHPTVPALALSGLPVGSDGVIRGLAGGFNAHLTKPFDNNELVKLVHQLLDRQMSGVPVEALACQPAREHGRP